VSYSHSSNPLWFGLCLRCRSLHTRPTLL
jgi:hypothetical protein